MKFGKLILTGLTASKGLRLDSSKELKASDLACLRRSLSEPAVLNVLSAEAFVDLPFDADWSAESWTKTTTHVTFLTAGIYQVHLDVSGSVSGADAIEAALMFGTYAPPPGSTIYTVQAQAAVTGATFHMSCSTIVQAAANDDISAALANMTDTDDITVNYANLLITRLKDLS